MIPESVLTNCFYHDSENDLTKGQSSPITKTEIDPEDRKTRSGS